MSNQRNIFTLSKNKKVKELRKKLKNWESWIIYKKKNLQIKYFKVSSWE